MGRQIPDDVLDHLGVEREEAPARRGRPDSGRGEDVGLERIEWAVMERRPCSRRGPGIAIGKNHEVQLSLAGRELLKLSEGDCVAVGWNAARHQAVVQRIEERDPRAGKLRQGGYVGRLAGRFLLARGYVQRTFYPGEVQHGVLVVPLPAEKGAGGGRAES